MSQRDRTQTKQRRVVQAPPVPHRPEHPSEAPEAAEPLRASDLAQPATLTAPAVGTIQHAAGNAAVASLFGGLQSADLIPDSGQPLDPSLAARMEAAFGTSFSDVRVHAGPDATASAAALRARAYTIGTDIVQGETGSGDRVMAHELAHVVQNRGGASSAGAPVGGATVARFGLDDLGSVAQMAGPMLGAIPGLGGVGSAMAGGLPGMLGGLGSALGGVLGGGSDLLGTLGSAAGSALGGGSIPGILGGLGSTAGSALGGVLGGGSDILGGLGGAVGNALGGGGVGGLEQTAAGALGGLGNALGGGESDMLGGLTNMLGGLFG